MHTSIGVCVPWGNVSNWVLNDHVIGLMVIMKPVYDSLVCIHSVTLIRVRSVYLRWWFPRNSLILGIISICPSCMYIQLPLQIPLFGRDVYSWVCEKPSSHLALHRYVWIATTVACGHLSVMTNRILRDQSTEVVGATNHWNYKLHSCKSEHILRIYSLWNFSYEGMIEP